MDFKINKIIYLIEIENCLFMPILKQHLKSQYNHSKIFCGRGGGGSKQSHVIATSHFFIIIFKNKLSGGYLQENCASMTGCNATGVHVVS